VVSARITSWLAAVGVGVAAFIGARLGMLPGVGFWDTAELQTVAPLLGTAHPTGYPTYVLLGWMADKLLGPFGEAALRMTLFSGLCVALAVAVTVDLVRVLTRSTVIGVAVGLGLAFTTVVWRIGVQAEAHSLHLALTVIVFRLLVAWETSGRDRTLVAAVVVFALAVGNHSLSLLLIPPIGLFVLAADREVVHRPRFVVGCVVVFLVTTVAIFLELPLRAGPFRAPLVYGRPETWDGFWYVVLAEQFRGSLLDPFGNVLGKLSELIGRAVSWYGPFSLFLPLGLVATILLRPRYALLSGTAAGITCFFAASYINADIERYYLVPVFIGWTWLGILAGGVATVVARNLGAERRPEPLMAVALAAVIVVPTAVAAPARFQAIDRSRDDVATEWLDHALDVMDQHAVIVSWWSYSTTLWYAQLIQGRRPDIDIIDDRTRLDRNLGDITDVIDAYLPTRPVYVIRIEDSEILELDARYELQYLEAPSALGLTRVLGPKAGG